MEYDPYHDFYAVATQYLRTFAANLGLDESGTTLSLTDGHSARRRRDRFFNISTAARNQM
jgi:hypothetical protein